jgi:hypothetical protein
VPCWTTVSINISGALLALYTIGGFLDAVQGYREVFSWVCNMMASWVSLELELELGGWVSLFVVIVVLVTVAINALLASNNWAMMGSIGAGGLATGGACFVADFGTQKSA